MKKTTNAEPTTEKPTAPAEGNNPETTTANGTTVLADPADAPAPKAGRKTKAAPTPEATPAAEVPEWTRRAAARDTATEMAAAPETEPTPEAAADPVSPARSTTTSKPTPRTRPGSKATKKPAAKGNESAPPKAGSLRAIGDGWLDALRKEGHTPSTISSYENDLALAYEHLGGDEPAKELTEKQITGFNNCSLVTKKRNGKAKAQPTILKTRRALRLALVWAEEKGLIKKGTVPAKTPA